MCCIVLLRRCRLWLHGWLRRCGAPRRTDPMATVAEGKKSTGNYALMHAIAMNAFHPQGILFNFLNFKRRIKCHQAYYRSLGNKLKLRWAGEMRNYYLELKSNANYGDGVTIRYSLTNLWFDEDMRESQADLTSDEADG